MEAIFCQFQWPPMVNLKDCLPERQWCLITAGWLHWNIFFSLDCFIFQDSFLFCLSIFKVPFCAVLYFLPEVVSNLCYKNAYSRTICIVYSERGYLIFQWDLDQQRQWAKRWQMEFNLVNVSKIHGSLHDEHQETSLGWRWGSRPMLLTRCGLWDIFM